ncbi:hypothetical protein VTH82DRAFT_5069 [Thermothelomyces myriococcoides]
MSTTSVKAEDRTETKLPGKGC